MTDKRVLEFEKMIYSIAYKMNHSDIEDLVQEGYIGLSEAEKTYDSSVGTKFSTHAYMHIWGRMKQFIENNRGVKVNREIRKRRTQIQKLEDYLTQANGHAPTNEELAQYIGVSAFEIAQAKLSLNPTYSIESTVANDGKDLTLLDTIPGREYDNDALIILKQKVKELPEPDKSIFINYYLKDMTQQQLASNYGMTQVKVSRNLEKSKQYIRAGISA